MSRNPAAGSVISGFIDKDEREASRGELRDPPVMPTRKWGLQSHNLVELNSAN